MDLDDDPAVRARIPWTEHKKGDPLTVEALNHHPFRRDQLLGRHSTRSGRQTTRLLCLPVVNPYGSRRAGRGQCIEKAPAVGREDRVGDHISDHARLCKRNALALPEVMCTEELDLTGAIPVGYNRQCLPAAARDNPIIVVLAAPG